MEYVYLAGSYFIKARKQALQHDNVICIECKQFSSVCVSDVWHLKGTVFSFLCHFCLPSMYMPHLPASHWLCLLQFKAVVYCQHAQSGL